MVELFISQRGTKSWYLDHQRHRANGPAIQFTDGVLHWFWYGHPGDNKWLAYVYSLMALRVGSITINYIEPMVLLLHILMDIWCGTGMTEKLTSLNI
jgi:hypothetical protein